MPFSYEITPRPIELGGGWLLHLLEDDQEVGGGVFAPVEDREDAREALQAALDEAETEAHAWLDSREAEGL